MEADASTIQVNGLQLAYHAMGEPENPLALFIHGFPDTAHTFNHFLPEIASDGDYSVRALAQDALGIVKALEKERVIFVGHDWGASAAYQAAAIAPEVVAKLVVIAILHPSVIRPSLETFRKAPHFLQLPFGPASEWLVRRNNFAYLDKIYAYWSPKWDVPEDVSLQVKSGFARPGRLKAALGFYSSFMQGGLTQTERDYAQQKITVPTLAIAGEADAPVDINLFEEARSAFTSSYQFVQISIAGHCPHQEASEIFLTELRAFLRESS